MSLSTQPYKGARDFYPEDKRIQKYMFGVLRAVVESFGYQEYDAPILEPFEIYSAKTGDEIVNEQLYSFEDKGGRKVALRPEMTPSVSRLVAGRRQELAYPQRLYSLPNLWRYERPQHGRLREHWQLNVDLFGIEGIEADAEIIQVADAILKAFKADQSDYEIRINSLQSANAIYSDLNIDKANRQKVSKLLDKRSKLSESMFDELLNQAVGQELSAKLKEYWAQAKPPDNAAELIDLLKSTNVPNVIFDPEIVRGFDYYTDIVFEVYDKHVENNRSMFGGGRYDGLVGLFGVEPLPTVGFGMGDVTLQNFLEAHNLLPKLKGETDLVAILVGQVYRAAQKPLTELRGKGLKIAVDPSKRKIDSQIKNAVKSNIRYALFIGQAELDSNLYKLRDLEKGEEKQLNLDQIVEVFQRSSD